MRKVHSHRERERERERGVVGVTRWEGGRLVLIPDLAGVWDGMVTHGVVDWMSMKTVK